jgi:pyruvate formate lyase activating enzyme
VEKEARLYHSAVGGDVVCDLCHHRCRITPSNYGACGVRLNRDGSLFTQVYGEVIAAHIDPIEKKPLYHFFPGSLSLSVATIGCNFRCSFCQNWQISQNSKNRRPDFSGRKLSPREIVDSARSQDCVSIAYTYTEPTIFFEYALDTARLAAEAGIYNVFVTNGYMTPEALETIRPYLHACNVDLKSFRDEFYKSMCGAHVEPVLESIRLLRKMGIWVEVTTLVVPDVNDSSSELSAIAGFIAEVDPDIPWHVSRFHPDFQYLDARPTPVETLRRAYDLGRSSGLRYIYVGNVWGEAEDTLCPGCGRSLISRTGFSITSFSLDAGRCPYCETTVAGVFRNPPETKT